MTIHSGGMAMAVIMIMLSMLMTGCQNASLTGSPSQDLVRERLEWKYANKARATDDAPVAKKKFSEPSEPVTPVLSPAITPTHGNGGGHGSGNDGGNDCPDGVCPIDP